MGAAPDDRVQIYINYVDCVTAIGLQQTIELRSMWITWITGRNAGTIELRSV